LSFEFEEEAEWQEEEEDSIGEFSATREDIFICEVAVLDEEELPL